MNFFKTISGYFNKKSVGMRSCVHLITTSKPRGRALLSYITKPFLMTDLERQLHAHTNVWECWCITDILRLNGYDVDVIDYRCKELPEYKYDVIIDIHGNLGEWSDKMPCQARKILHITGAHWLTQNQAELRRLEMLKRRRDCVLLPRRLSPPVHGIEYADCATYLGNQFTADSFAYAKKPMYRIPLSTVKVFSAPLKEDIDARRNHYIWLGSSGAVHKGLDLVLEAFASLPECELYVCGPVDREKDFIAAYNDELFFKHNIHFMGWVDVHRDAFEKLMRTCIGIVYPSCSEGCAGSVVTCTHAGLIPIVTYESGVEVQDFGFTVTASIENIQDTVQRVSAMSMGELLSRSQATWEYARSVHTRDAFRENYSQFVSQIIEERSMKPLGV